MKYKFLRKTISALAIASILALSLTACGSQAPAGGPEAGGSSTAQEQTDTVEDTQPAHTEDAQSAEDAAPTEDEPLVVQMPTKAPNQLELGDAAPVFTANLADGDVMELASLQGKPVFVNFWATWCYYCVEEMPDLQKLYEEYGDQVQFLMVDVGESTDVVDDFIAEMPYTFPYVYDDDLSISNLYPTQGIPFTAVIAPDGTLSDMFPGAAPYEYYKAAIEKALGE